MMEDKNVLAAPSHTGAIKKIECKHFLGSSCQPTATNAIETLDSCIVGNIAKGGGDTEEQIPDTNSSVFELSIMVDALPHKPNANQAGPQVDGETVKMNTEAEEELNDDEDEGQRVDDAIGDRSTVSSDSVTVETDEEQEEKHLPPCSETDPDCPFAECDVHKQLCDVCHKYCLVPGDSEQRRIHKVECTMVHIRESESATELQQSYDKMCSICMEIVMDKRPREQRFGILPKCRHVFCLKCIRNWRKTDIIPGRVRRGCPVCRIVSNFVCPSFLWVEEYKAKAKLIKAFMKGCQKIDCKHFQGGRKYCNFGRHCFYRHAKK